MKKDKNLLDIVFGQSAAGGLKLARNYGKDLYKPKAAHFVLTADGVPLSQQEMESYRKEAEEKERIKWEKAVPMDIGDVVCLAFGLAEGDISEEVPAEKRLSEMKASCTHLPEAYSTVAEEMFEESVHALKKVLNHTTAGKPVRIWYSNNPYELCGLYHLVYQITKVGKYGEIYTVFLPDTVQKADGTIVRHMGWGGVSPREWQDYFNPQQVTDTFITMCAGEWRRLKADNAPVRGILNGVLQSFPEDIYDSFILKEINAAETEFMQAKIVGTVLGKYQLAISDGWVARRMEKMIQQGIITPVTAPPADSPVYHRMMKKEYVKCMSE